jgi:hypothetical protein
VVIISERTRASVLSALLLMSLSQFGTAQEVVAPTPVVTQHLLEAEPPSSSLRLGPFDFFPRASGQALFDDNIFASSTTRQSDLIWSFTPGGTMVLGDPAGLAEKSLTLDYSPSFIVFTKDSHYNTVDNIARLSGTWPFSKLTLGFSQDFADVSSVVLGAAARVEHQSYNTGLTSHYELSEKTSFDINGRLAITDYQQQGYLGSTEWVNDDWLNYQLSPKLTSGAGFTIGYLESDQNPNQLYERLSVRSSYTLTGKVDVNASVGVERRAYSGFSDADYYPVFSVGGGYRPTPLMTISLNASRNENSSAYLPGQNYASTGFSLTVQETIREQFLLNLSGGYDNMEYHSNTSGSASTLSNNTFYVRPAFDWLIRSNWRTGVFYVYRQNTSTQSGYDYANNQVGLQVSWSY